MAQQSPFRENTLEGKASVAQAGRYRFFRTAARIALTLQVAFITGGGSGIGFEIARQLGNHRR